MPGTPVFAPENKRQIAGTAVVIALLLLVVASIAIVAIVFVRRTEPDFTGWWREVPGPRRTGICEIERDGHGYLVRDVLASGIDEHDATLEGDKLVVMQINGRVREYTLTSDPQRLTLRVLDVNTLPARDTGIRLIFARWNETDGQRAMAAAQDAAIEAGRRRKAKEAAVKEGIHALQIAIQSWAVDHGDQWPPRSVVRAGGAIASYVDRWPKNPYTGETMAADDGPGDYTYLREGGQYRLTGHFEGGAGYTVP